MFDSLTIVGFVMIISGILALFIWALGKSLGWIHSPLWVEHVPQFAEVVIFGGFFVSVGKVLQRLTHMEGDLKELKTEVRRIDENVKALDKRVTILETIIKTILKKLKL